MNTTVTRYDTAFYVQALDRFVATGECAETDTEPLYAYLLSVMNDSMVKVQVLGDEVCARIFYDTMIQFIQLNLEKERYHLRKSQSERTGMKLVLEWSMAKRKDGWQALLQQISDKYREYGFDSRFYRSHFGTEGGYADDEVWESWTALWQGRISPVDGVLRQCLWRAPTDLAHRRERCRNSSLREQWHSLSGRSRLPGLFRLHSHRRVSGWAIACIRIPAEKPGRPCWGWYDRSSCRLVSRPVRPIRFPRCSCCPNSRIGLLPRQAFLHRRV